MKDNPSFDALLKNKAMLLNMLKMLKDPKNTQIREMVSKQLPQNISIDTAVRVIEFILKVAGPALFVKNVLTHKVTKLVLFGLVVWLVASYLI